MATQQGSGGKLPPNGKQGSVPADPTEKELEVYWRYCHRAVLSILRDFHQAEDVAQDAAEITLQRYRAGQIREPKALGAYMTMVGRRSALQNLRRLRLQREYAASQIVREDGQGLGQTPDSVRSQPMQDLHNSENGRILREAIHALRMERDREVLLGIYLRDRDLRVLARELGVSGPLFRKVLHRALRRLSKELVRQGHDPGMIAEMLPDR